MRRQPPSTDPQLIDYGDHNNSNPRPMDRLTQIRALLDEATADEKDAICADLARICKIHPLERKWNVSAQDILDAIQRAPDLTHRGIRGVIADAAFTLNVIRPLAAAGWNIHEAVGDVPYDALIEDAGGRVTVQVKMQRQKAQRPMLASEANKILRGGPESWVVEVQKTRAGKDSEGNETRPYKFNDFDILAVALHPSTNDWSKFRYTVARWLMPSPSDAKQIFKYQAVPKAPDANWTDDLGECIAWHRSGRQRS